MRVQDVFQPQPILKSQIRRVQIISFNFYSLRSKHMHGGWRSEDKKKNSPHEIARHCGPIPPNSSSSRADSQLVDHNFHELLAATIFVDIEIVHIANTLAAFVHIAIQSTNLGFMEPKKKRIKQFL
ncbi:hypothetical protein LguiB_015673 [Lonicera macranthoides]